MVKKVKNFFQKNALLISSILFMILFAGAMQIFAAAPAGGYAPGATLNPDCAPGDGDCIVNIEATDIDYDNTISVLTATNVQSAIDELDGVVDGMSASPITIVNSSNLFSTGLTGTGSGVTLIADSIFLGRYSGSSATGTSNSNFIGYNAGGSAVGSNNSNFIGLNAGYLATGVVNSNFFGPQAGLLAANSANSNFLGYNSGYSSTGANNSNFLGYEAGYFAGSANNSNFLGRQTGYFATNAGSSNFFGYNAGYSADNADNSNFFGYNAGYTSDNADNSNFFGQSAGSGATNAGNSNFIGFNAGLNAINAANSIFIGNSAGGADLVNNTLGGTSILIGDNTSTGGNSNSIAFGAGATNTLSNELMIGSVASPINVTTWKMTAGDATLSTTGLITTSDERLKQNIIDLPDDVLSKLLNVRTVTFNWTKGDTDTNNIGFIAQDLEQYFPELVYTGSNHFKGVNYANMTPVLTKAIQELDLKIESLVNLNEPIIDEDGIRTFAGRFFDRLISWLGDATNGIEKIFTKEIHTEKICVKKSDGTEVCITGDQLDQLLSTTGTSGSSSSENSGETETCFDSIQNQDETGIDMGGVCESVPISEEEVLIEETLITEEIPNPESTPEPVPELAPVE